MVPFEKSVLFLVGVLMPSLSLPAVLLFGVWCTGTNLCSTFFMMGTGNGLCVLMEICKLHLLLTIRELFSGNVGDVVDTQQ